MAVKPLLPYHFKQLPILVGFTGVMGSGKTEAAMLMHKYNFMKISFADPLKDKAMKITPDGKIDKLRDRRLLQFLGKDYFRDQVSTNFWVEAWGQRVLAARMNNQNVVTDDLRFHTQTDTDLSGDNEYLALRAFGGFFVNIVTSDKIHMERLKQRDGTTSVGIVGHASEIPLNPEDPRIDYTIKNDGTKEDLFAELGIMLVSIRT